MQTPRIEIRRGRTGLYRFVVIASNGEPLATGEHHKSKRNAMQSALALRKIMSAVIPIVTPVKR